VFELLATTVVFLGACLDTGAQLTVISIKKEEAYIKFTGGTGTIKHVGAKTVYQFGGGKHNTVGCLDIRVPFSEELIIIMVVDVIMRNVPFLLGLETLDRYKMYVINVTDELVCVKEGINLPTIRSDGHAYYRREWSPDILYTFPELVRIHRHFSYASPERLYAVMRRAKTEGAVPETLQRLQDVAAACDVCQRLAKERGRFRAALPEGEVIFNRVVLIDLMFLRGRAVLHIDDQDTLFSAATFLRDVKSTAAVWDAYMSVWVTTCASYSHHIHFDAGNELHSAERRAGPFRIRVSQQNLGYIQIYPDISVGIFSPSNVRAKRKTLLESSPHAQALRGKTDEHQMLLRAECHCLQNGALSESLFQSPWWKALLHAAGVQVYNSGVESHNSLGAGER